jgi:hypothetical protein
MSASSPFAYYTISFSLTKIEMSEFPEKRQKKALKPEKPV